VAAAKGERQAAGFRAVGIAAGRLAGPIIARSGGGVLARLKSHWPAIAGSELAGVTWPEALTRAGTLKLRVLPPAALEVQHCTPLVIERINLFFGRDAVTRLALVQGPLPLAAAPAPPALAEPGADAAAALDARLAGIGDEALRAALSRLGRAVIAAEAEEDG
jgi:hypothetical protein